MDTTFFGREFGILVIMDSVSEKVVYHQLVKTERDEYYHVALNRLREKRLYHSINYLRWSSWIA
ncbi:hypothetical protein [Ursidibacter arcticus]